MTVIRPILALILLLSPAFAETPLVVEIVDAKASADTQYFSLTGETIAKDALGASFPSGGRIAEVFVEEGDTVTAGTQLARIESVQQEQALRSAEAGLTTAKADHLQAIEDMNRQVSLLERGATTKILRDNAEDVLNIAQGVLAQAQANLDRAQKALEDTVLLAPRDATVMERSVEPGQVVGAAQSILELALGKEIDAVFEVPEVLLAYQDPASAIELELIERPGVSFRGEIREVSPLVDPTTGTVSVTVTVIDAPDFVSYGDAIRGTTSAQGTPHITLPHTAMSVTMDGPAVWIVDPDTMTVSLRQISVDRYETGRIVLSGGVEEGMQVVSRGAHLLYPGRVVREVELDK
ncbi:MAG: efflux RND transporter periplasmic adaptor subunit [Sulfitobacter sp.]